MIVREEQIGPHRLILGDSREVLPDLTGIDCVVTSPPYGQQRDYGKKIDNWRDVVSGVMTAIPDSGKTQVLCNLGLIHKNGEVWSYWDDLIADMRANNWRLFSWYVWDKLNGTPGAFGGRLAPSFEFVFHFNRMACNIQKTKATKGGRIHSGNLRKADGTKVAKSHDGKRVQPFKIADSVIRVPPETSNDEFTAHPARFPERLAIELFEPFTMHGQTVCDPFAGSGTVAVACERMGRKSISIELDPGYFDIACRRVEAAMRQPRFDLEPPKKAEQVTFDLGDPS